MKKVIELLEKAEAAIMLAFSGTDEADLCTEAINHINDAMDELKAPPQKKNKNPFNLDFGDYVKIEQKRYGCKNEIYLHKVINVFRSNSWVDVPVQTPAKETLHEKTENVVSCVTCGVCETDVFRYRIEDVKKAGKDKWEVGE